MVQTTNQKIWNTAKDWNGVVQQLIFEPCPEAVSFGLFWLTATANVTWATSRGIPFLWLKKTISYRFSPKHIHWKIGPVQSECSQHFVFLQKRACFEPKLTLRMSAERLTKWKQPFPEPKPRFSTRKGLFSSVKRTFLWGLLRARNLKPISTSLDWKLRKQKTHRS